MDRSMLLIRSNNTDVMALSTTFGGKNSLNPGLASGQKCIAYIGWGDDDSAGLESLISLLGVMRHVWHISWLWNYTGRHEVGAFVGNAGEKMLGPSKIRQYWDCKGIGKDLQRGGANNQFCWGYRDVKPGALRSEGATMEPRVPTWLKVYFRNSEFRSHIGPQYWSEFRTFNEEMDNKRPIRLKKFIHSLKHSGTLEKGSCNLLLPHRTSCQRFATMNALVRESLFGRLLNLFTGNKALPYSDLEISKFETLSTSATSTNSVTLESGQQFTVEFSGDDDPDMPRNWSRLSKMLVMLDVMFLNFSFYAASAIFTPSIPGIEEQFGATTAEGTLGLSLFVIAYGIGPLFVRIHQLKKDQLWLIIRFTFPSCLHYQISQPSAVHRCMSWDLSSSVC